MPDITQFTSTRFCGIIKSQGFKPARLDILVLVRWGEDSFIFHQQFASEHRSL
jgi:hypothetical protein